MPLKDSAAMTAGISLVSWVTGGATTAVLMARALSRPLACGFVALLFPPWTGAVAQAAMEAWVRIALWRPG